MGGKTLDEFRRLHDPMFGIHAPTHVYSRELPPFSKAIVVAAQNATPVHADFWACLLTAAKRLKAELFVIPTRYKNPTSHWSGSQKNAEYYDPAVVPYLWNQRLNLNANLTLLADVPTQPTAAQPLASLDGMSHASSGIVGHMKLQYKTVPTPGSRMAKILTTTGGCTVSNYTESRNGKIGEFHHSLSAVLVELDGERFHMRQLHFSKQHAAVTDGAKGVVYKANGRTCKAPRPLALGMGDTHVDVIDPAVERATFADGGIIDTLRPEYVVYADLLDCHAVNPHDLNDPFIQAAKYDAGRNDIRAEVNRAIEFVRTRTFRGVTNVIQAANHNDMLRRWVLRDFNWRLDHVNSDFGLETALHMRRNVRMAPTGPEYPDPFKYWFDNAKVPQARVLDLDESFMLANVELGMHGDIGPNGSRGSRKNLARIGTKSIIFHSHSPGIEEGCYQAGTSTLLRLAYVKGPSSWLNTHVLLQHDGKRQLINIIDGVWHA
jgi:hypothetical protein